nr:MAG TPA: hypothetical protein [Caudoviricetes sp.]
MLIINKKSPRYEGFFLFYFFISILIIIYFFNCRSILRYFFIYTPNISIIFIFFITKVVSCAIKFKKAFFFFHLKRIFEILFCMCCITYKVISFIIHIGIFSFFD